MKILGVDPGLAEIGYGVVEEDGNSLSQIEFGLLRTSSEKSDLERLNIVFEELTKIIKRLEPEQMAVEELFFNKNAKTAIRVGQARGVILLAGSRAGIPVFEYTPLEVKQAVVGHGRAEKMQVQQMVKTLLGLAEIPASEDAADALAVSICHCHTESTRNSWSEML